MKKASLGLSVLVLGLFVASAAQADNKKPNLDKSPKFKMIGKTVRLKGAAPVSLAKRFSHLAPAVKVANDPLNLVKLKEKATGGKRCGIVEVSPGNFVRMDCNNYTKPKKTTLHLGVAKARALKTRQFAISRTSNFLLRAKGAAPAPAPTPTPTPTPKPGFHAGIGEGGGGAQIAEDLPDTVDHRAMGVSGPIKSQGSVGACTAFALSTTVDNQLRRAGREDTTSPSHVWAGYGMPNMEDAADYNIGRGLATYDTWSYSQKEGCRLARSPFEECQAYLGVPTNSYRTDSTLMKSLSKSDSTGKVKIASIEELVPTNTDELVATLASGNDIWAAMYIDGSKWTNSAMKKDVIPDWSNNNGGHAVAIAGYRETSGGRQYLIHNSWGQSWGDKGYAWVSEKMIKSNLKQAYRVKLEGDAVAPIELTDDDCAWDQLVDGISGKCAKICPDDSRPQNGKCS